MTNNLLPAIWLIVLITGLPQLSETVYTPSLPDIAYALQTSETMVEYTLTIYLFGFAIGTLFWGRISDNLGRKPCVIGGSIVFTIGCIGCYFSPTIKFLMLSRFIQAFGGSIGSVLTQAICRDAFHGPALGRAYSSTGSAIALFPALGPLCGGVIAQYFGWSNIFLFLTVFSLIVIFLAATQLPETHPKSNRSNISIIKLAMNLMGDKKVIGLGLIVAGCNGITFSYFAEGSFYLIKGLGLSPSKYGLSFIFAAVATMLGGLVSRRLQSFYSPKTIMGYGLVIISVSTAILSIIVIVNHNIVNLSPSSMIIITILSQMSSAFGICMATSNALALALVDYKYAIGTASSLFGFFYYCLISVFTLGMGLLHNGTLLPMPIYFFGISLFILLIKQLCLKRYV